MKAQDMKTITTMTEELFAAHEALADARFYARNEIDRIEAELREENEELAGNLKDAREYIDELQNAMARLEAIITDARCLPLYHQK